MPATYVAPNHLLPLYLAWQLDPERADYHINFSYKFENYCDVEELVKQVRQLVALRPYLRQTFQFQNGQLIAIIHEVSPLVVDSHAVKYVEFLQLEQKLIQAPFFLENTPPLRLQIVHITDWNTYSVLFTVHHIIMDGITLNIFIDDLNNLLSDRQVISESAEDYISKICSEPALQNSEKNEELRALCTDYVLQISNLMANLELPSIVVEKSTSETRVLHYTAVMPGALSEKLKSFSQKNDMSIFNVLLVTYGLFLAKIMDQKCMVVRYPINIRKNRKMLGCFVNILGLPLELNEAYDYISLIQRMRDIFYKLDMLHMVALDAKLKIHNTPNFSSFARLDPLIIHGKPYESDSYPQIANGFISIKYRKKKQEFYFACDVLSAVYPKFLATSLLPRFFYFLEKLLDSPEKLLSTTDLLFDEEKKRLLVDWNSTTVPYPKNKTLVDCFMDMVSLYPNKLAIKNHQGSMTYGQLNQCAENIAAELINRGVRREELVGILIDHRLEMITALFGVLKASAAYVPLAHNTPVERVAAITKDSGMRFLLTISEWRRQIKGNDVQIIDISEAQCSALHYCLPDISATQIAYAIYTSGTTGRPKGILIEHSGVVNYANFLIRDNSITHQTIGSKYAGFGFDLSVSEIYPILLSGGTLCLIDEKNRQDCDAINIFFEKNNITYALLPTKIGEQFFELKNITLKNLGVGGEKLNRFIKQKYRVVNMYGPTESTVQATYFVLSEPISHIPIGKPIDNTKCYVLDHDSNLLPVGVTGELCISGVGLARSYVNSDDLTKKKFVSNPFHSSVDESEIFDRLYKTGDLVRWREDGNLEYRGRRDSQVKLSGCRVELEEIEHLLVGHPAITRSAVRLEKEGLRAYLVAYYTLRMPVTREEMLNYLSAFLPSYMLPSVFIPVENFSFTVNGKIDRAALPVKNWNELETYLAPTNEVQKLICQAFMDVLGLVCLGLSADFFALGGDSMKAINLVNRLRNNFKINVSDIYTHCTPERLAEKIEFFPNSLSKRLLQIKIQSVFASPNLLLADSETMRRISHYRANINYDRHFYSVKSMRTVLLTGVTGYLGCNILDQLLKLTTYMLVLPIRAKDREQAWKRLHEKYRLYFDASLTPQDMGRITIVVADLEKPCIGVGLEAFQVLAGEVDAIIHAAALVKHYGDYQTFYSANVEATRNMLEFAKITKGRDFHYISTASILCSSQKSQSNLFTEHDDNPQDWLDTHPPQVYIRTKFEGEALVVSYREQGVKGNIYRVGNLAFMLANGRLQQNREDNAFYQRVKILLEWRIVSNILGLCNISPVDLTAKAIVLLFDKQQIENTFLHVFNPYTHNLADIVLAADRSEIRSVAPYTFVNYMIDRLKDERGRLQVERFMLHQGWLESYAGFKQAALVLQERTQEMLAALNFFWTPINMDVLCRYINSVQFKT